MQDVFDVYKTGRPCLPIPAATLGLAASSPINRTCIVEYLAFANHDAAAQTVTVTDGAGKQLFPAISIAAAETEVLQIPDGGLYFHGGVSWLASKAASVDGWIRARPY
jgi:hypothetical protein